MKAERVLFGLVRGFTIVSGNSRTHSNKRQEKPCSAAQVTLQTSVDGNQTQPISITMQKQF